MSGKKPETRERRLTHLILSCGNGVTHHTVTGSAKKA
jgi:hypothetical protein